MLRSIYYKLKTLGENNLKIGKNVHFKNCVFEGENYLANNVILKNSRLGYLSYIGAKSNLNLVEIGKFSSVGPNVLIGLGEHPTNRLATHPVFYKNFKHTNINFIGIQDFTEYRQTRIGSDCWIGSNTIIRGGVTIGDGAIVAAGSIVTKDIEPFSIVGGNPAKLIRYRFSNTKINEILANKWWNWDLKDLQRHIELFSEGKSFDS